MAAWLNAGDPALVQKGLARVAAWRCRGRVPLGADIFACLVEIQFRDPCSGARFPPLASAQPVDDGALRLQYAMAIVRLVNGIADAAQKGRTAVSVAGLAAQAGLPRMLVDLRHEATHNELPSLPLLRLAAHQALAWLRACYWQAQADQLAASEARYRQLLQELLASFSQRLVGDLQLLCTPQPPGTASDATQKRQRATLAELRGLVPSAAAALLATPLLEPGFVHLPASNITAALTGSPAADMVAAAAAAAAAAPEPAADAAGDTAHLQAWEACLAALQQDWPSLPGLVLAGAVSQLADGDAPAAHAAAWVRLLLQHAAAGPIGEPKAAARSSNSSSSRIDEASLGHRLSGQRTGFAWQPTAAQATQLLATCIAAQQRIVTGGSGASPASLSADDARQRAAALLDVALALAQHVSKEGSAGAAMDTGQSYDVQEAAQQQAQFVQAAKATAQPAAAAGSSRWQLVQQWLPCAIGGTPSAHDLNGVFAALPQQRAEPNGGEHAAVGELDQQEETDAAAPDYFARFEGDQQAEAMAQAWVDEQNDGASEHLARISAANIVVW